MKLTFKVTLELDIPEGYTLNDAAIVSNVREATIVRWERRIVKTYVYEF